MILWIRLVLLCLLSLSVWAKEPERPMVVPAHLSQDVDSLATYLVGTANTPRLKAERIFGWITANINYDIPMLRADKAARGDTSPATVLRRRQSICAGYAGLFQALGQKAGLQVETISGWARSIPGEKGDSHAWNAVMLDGRWQLLDCTWGAGYVQGDDYYRSVDPFYFLSDPKEFLTSHFPDDPKWQLVDLPLSRAEFDQLTPFRPLHYGSGTLVPVQDYTQASSSPTPASPAATTGPTLTSPRQLSSFAYRGVRLIVPSAGTLRQGRCEFHLEAPSADRVVVITAEQIYALLPVPKKLGQFRAMVPLLPGKIRVLAEFGSSGRLEPLLEYDSR